MKAVQALIHPRLRAASLHFGVSLLVASLAALHEKDARWKLVINEPVEIDS